jgi:hypothetical protein
LHISDGDNIFNALTFSIVLCAISYCTPQRYEEKLEGQRIWGEINKRLKKSHEMIEIDDIVFWKGNTFVCHDCMCKTVEDSCLRKRGVQIVSCRPSIFRGKNVSFDVAPGQFVATKPMESLDETIGFVCENQWSRWTITMASFANIGGLMKKNWRKN